MKTIIITDELLEEAINAELQALQLEKIAPEPEPKSKESSIEYRMSKYVALRVDFLDTAEELRLYTEAIYNAVIWGQKLR